ncbi:MAG: signal peptidase II [Verrucomicrobiae bacterium]|nr:signal peptidase II [Verrucomicrobiae bacterium]MCP5539113.1 signal peptidase II [Akkermansiaceae bacterium]MCP5549764.1 signal peptidase II [Akkermansiaceae bacterium]
MRYILFLSLPLFFIDQLTKYWIVSDFPAPDSAETQRVIEAIPGFFNIVRVHNTGMAFGRFNGAEHANLAFGAIAITALGAIFWLWKKGAFPGPGAKTAAALLVSGILGNFTDRVLPGRGYVVDFLDFFVGAHHWPSFNVADSCICVAAGLLFVSAFRGEESARGAEPANEGP